MFYNRGIQRVDEHAQSLSFLGGINSCLDSCSRNARKKWPMMGCHTTSKEDTKKQESLSRKCKQVQLQHTHARVCMQVHTHIHPHTHIYLHKCFHLVHIPPSSQCKQTPQQVREHLHRGKGPGRGFVCSRRRLPHRSLPRRLHCTCTAPGSSCWRQSWAWSLVCMTHPQHTRRQ